MSSVLPDTPHFETPVYGTVFAERSAVVGRLSPDVNAWMAPRMLGGARYGAHVCSVGEPDTASWKRLVIVVRRV